MVENDRNNFLKFPSFYPLNLMRRELFLSFFTIFLCLPLSSSEHGRPQLICNDFFPNCQVSFYSNENYFFKGWSADINIRNQF